MKKRKYEFDRPKIRIALRDIHPTFRKTNSLHVLKRYRAIRAFVNKAEKLEPLTVLPHETKSGKYRLMDGHLRYQVLKDFGRREAECVVEAAMKQGRIIWAK